MFVINKVISIPTTTTLRGHVGDTIVRMVEELVHARIFYVEYTELPLRRDQDGRVLVEDKFKRRFLVKEAFNERDK